ncbi:MAG: hypothetical protein MJ210_00990 [Alphaproteobacteria bacterium]|nr:hypothetical protein [Alphaproteobacteria bacterium]
MNENLKFLLSWINDPSKKILLVNTPQENLLSPTKGLVAEDGSAWLLQGKEKVKSLSEGDLIYVDGREYLEGPVIQQIYSCPVWAVVTDDDEVIMFAPQFKHLWQVWWFKVTIKKFFDKETYKQVAALADFLYKNRNIKKFY